MKLNQHGRSYLLVILLRAFSLPHGIRREIMKHYSLLNSTVLKHFKQKYKYLAVKL